MVRETRHLWVGNLPDNIREDRIREHFKRYGPVQSVKLLPRIAKEETGEVTMACTVAFMDIKSASKAHNAELKIDDRTLTTEYYEPAAIPSAASPQNTPSPYSTSPGPTRFPNGHGSTDEHGPFPDRFFDRTAARVAPEGEFIRRTYHDTARGRNRDRAFRNGPYTALMDRHRTLNNWPYDSPRYNSTGSAGQTDAGYTVTASSENSSERRNSDQNAKKKTKSRSGSRSVSPSGSTSSRSPSRSRSRSSSSSSSSTTSRDTSSSSSPKSRRLASSTNSSSHQTVVHSDDRRPLAICVKNLPLRSSDTSLKDGLFHEYKKHGKVKCVKVVGQSSERHAIVCFKKPEDVEKALEVSYDKQFFGCKIEVAPYQGYDVEDNDLRPYEAEIDEFHPKATRTLFIGNLEKDVTASDLRKHFDQFGEIIEIDIKKQAAVSSYAFCQYSDIVSVVKAIRKMDGEHLGNNRIKLGFGKSMPTNCVWVDGIGENVNEKYLRNHFDQFGVISKVHIDRDKGQALIFYDQVVGAQTSVNKMRGFSLKSNKIQVDFASRECQESFFEHLEKQGTVTDRTVFEERRDSASRTFEPSTNRFSRYDTPTRPRASSYSSRSSAAASQVTSAIPSPGTPGSVTPRGTSSRSRVSRFPEYYQGADYVERHFRSYDEYSQGSAASHEDAYEPEYVYAHDSPTHLDHLETRSLQSVDTGVPFAPPELRNLQKERVLLLEQLEECPSSGDEHVSPKKRLKLDLMDPLITSDVIIEANRDHRKVMEVRRLSDANVKHHSRRPSIDSGKHSSSRDLGHDRNTSYTPHAVCKRRKTSSSDGGSRVHHYEHSGSESVGGSRPGTPLCDERPEFPPTEPRRIERREREGPLTLPLPRFAAQVMNRGSVSVAGIKGQKDNVLASPPPAATSPRVANPRPPSPVHVPPPASPPPRPPSLSSNSSDSDMNPPSPSLEERIKVLDEKYEKWSGSRALGAAGSNSLPQLDPEKFRFRNKLLDLDLKEVQPSEIVKSVLAKRSVFDEDLKRLENVGDKYEPKEFNTFPRATSATQTPVPVTLTAPPTLKLAPTAPLPKTPTMLSPRSTGTVIPVKGLQYPFPSHPPVQPCTPVQLSQSSSTPATPTTVTTTASILAPSTSSSTTARGNGHGENRLKPCTGAPSDNRTSSKVNVNRSDVVSIKTSEKNNANIPITSDVTAISASATTTDVKHNKIVRETKSSDKTSDKVTSRRDSTASSNSSSPRADIKTRRNSDTSARRIEDVEKLPSKPDKIQERAKSEERKKEQRLEKARLESERLEKEKLEKERIENERLEKEKQEKERIERERVEKERRQRESELERKRLERERLEKERIEKERLEKEKQEKERAERERLEKERQEREKFERERRKEKEERERKEKEEKERKEKEERERREKEERERREKEEKARKEKEERERREKEERARKEKEEREQREKEERERKDKEDREKREREEQLEKEKQEKDRKEAEREEKERKEREERERRELEERLEKERQEKERYEKERQEKLERKREEEKSRHKEDNHEKRKDEHRHRESHSETRHRENNLDKHVIDSKSTKETSKEDKSKENIELTRREPHDSRSTHEKSRHHVDRDAERRKESVKENRDNNIHDKHRNFVTELTDKDRQVLETRHLSIELEKTKAYDGLLNKQDPSKRKDRTESTPAAIGMKRRLSSHDSTEYTDDSKRIKLSQEHKKLPERRDSKDSPKVKTKHKNNTVKTHETKVRSDKHNNAKEGDEKRKDREERHKSKQHKLEKQKSKSKSKEKESRESPSTPLTDKDFMERLELKCADDIEKQQRKESKEKRREAIEQEKREDEKKSEEKSKKEKPCQQERSKSHDEPLQKPSSEEKKAQKKERMRKVTQNSSDNTDSDEPKKHSIFDIVVDEPAYISMYDKVKARSCKNMQKQEEEKRQVKIKAEFSQLKQSRAKREEKKRSMSYDEDSDSDKERTEKSDLKSKRMSKMLIVSSDDEQERKFRKKKEMYTDSDSDKQRQIKTEMVDTSDDDHVRVKNAISLKTCKSRIASDTSDDEFKKELHIKSEDYSDLEPENKVVNIKDELERLIKKERRNSKHQDSMSEHISSQVYTESSISLPEVKTEKFNSRHSFGDNTSEEETTEIKKERSESRKKHKKKQKRQKHSISSEDSCKLNTPSDSVQSEPTERTKHHEKKKQHSKKDKKRDKCKDEREKSKKSRKNKAEKREGKMENIFGSLSEDSENGVKDQDQHELKLNTFHNKFAEGSPATQVCNDSDGEQETKLTRQEEKEREREEHRKRKEKRRREKERRLQEAAAAAAEAADDQGNDNSMDFVDMGKQLEANIKDDTVDTIDQSTKTETESSTIDGTENPFRFTDVDEFADLKKEDRKEPKEKKKKRKKSKEEKQKHHHHHHHHEKNKAKSPEIKKEVEIPEIKVEVEEPETPAPSLPTILDMPSPKEEKTSPKTDFSISPSTRQTLGQSTPLLSPIKTPTTSKDKKREKLIPGFGTDIDENLHETAVKSISEYEPVKQEVTVKEEEIKTPPKSEPVEEKPRVIISQEETEDAVAALLGESFGGASGQFDECYNEDGNNANDQTTALAEENNVQDDEEMRQAVQSLSAADLDVKPDTPQSEHELQIDTDTEEQEEATSRFDQPSKTPDMTDLLQLPKTPDIPSYFRNEDQKNTPSPLVLKATSNIGSPPLLTPIKPQPAVIAEVKKNLEADLKSQTSEQQPHRSVISQSWPVEKKPDLLAVKPEPTTLLKIDNKVIPLSIPKPIQSQVVMAAQPKPISSVPLRTYGAPPVIKVSEPNYPPLTALSKSDHPKLSSVLDKAQGLPVLQTANKQLNTPALHNLPARSPVPIKQPTVASQDSTLLSTKVTTTNVTLNRLPITPIIVSKPLQSTTVILPQAKVAHSLEPPKLVPTSDPRPQERPRMVYHQPPGMQPQFSSYIQTQPRMMVQNIRGLPQQGLLLPTSQLPAGNFSYLRNLNISQPTYGIPPLVKENLAVISESSAPIHSQRIIATHSTSSSHNSPVPPTIIMSTPRTQPCVTMSYNAQTSASLCHTTLTSTVMVQNSPTTVGMGLPTPSTTVGLGVPSSTGLSHSVQSSLSVGVNVPSSLGLPVPSSVGIVPSSVDHNVHNSITVGPTPNTCIQETPLKVISPPVATVLPQPPKPPIIQPVETKVAEIVPKTTESPDNNHLMVKTDACKRSTPSPVIVATPKESIAPPKESIAPPKASPITQENTPLVAETKLPIKESPPIETKPEPSPKPEPEQPVKLAIEKVTEELNYSLQKEMEEIKDEKKDVLETKSEIHTDSSEKSSDSGVVVKDEKLESPVDEDKKPETKNEAETMSVIKEIDKFEEEKADTESIVSDISKERSSADILSKDDPLDNKEDSDYWSAKEVNIDSVIKTLCSADELSDHSSEGGKDEPKNDWLEAKKANDSLKSDISEKDQSFEQKEVLTESKTEKSETNDEETEIEQVVVTTRATRRGGRARGGRKARGGIERGGIQTRRGKLAKELAVPAPVTPKRGARTTRQKNERKINKPELEVTSCTDIYEFRDDSDESNHNKERPRLILTIKSPAIASAANVQTAIIKEVSKEGVKEIVKDVVKEVPKEVASPPAPVKQVETKEEHVPPVVINTRKSSRLQGRDATRNNVDDTIEDVIRCANTRRAAAAAAVTPTATPRRSARQATPKTQPETPRKSPRGARKKDRRASEVVEDTPEEKPLKEIEVTPPEKVKDIESPKVETEVAKAELAKDNKPHEGLKATVLRRLKGEVSHEPTSLIDPVTGVLMPMRECEEGKYIPLPGAPQTLQKVHVVAGKPIQMTVKPVQVPGKPVQVPGKPVQVPVKPVIAPVKPVIAPVKPVIAPVKPAEPIQQQSVITQPQQQQQPQQPAGALQKQKPQSFKAHVLSSQVAKAIVSQQQTLPLQAKTSTVQPIISKTTTPISQNLNVNVSMAFATAPTHLSPRQGLPITTTTKPLPKVKPPLQLSPTQMGPIPGQPNKVLQVGKQPVQVPKSHLVSSLPTSQPQVVNTQMAHMKQQTTIMKQQVIMTSKGPMAKIPPHQLHQQQILAGAAASPPLTKGQPMQNAVRTIQGSPKTGSKGVMDPPKVDVSLPNVILGPRTTLSPQGQARHVNQAGMSVPGYEASLGEAIAHFPHGTVPIRSHHDLPHYMHPSQLNVMQYQKYFMQPQPYHLPRSPMVPAAGDKPGDGKEGEEAPVTSPPLRRTTGSIGHALTGRVPVPHNLHSPHDRTTDSPIYRSQPFHPRTYYDQTQPPPAHMPQTSHGSLAAIPSDRVAQMTPLGTPDRPLSGHLQPERPLSSHSALPSHMTSLAADRLPTAAHVERPMSGHMMGAGLGAAGNLLGAVARHVGADTPTTQRGLQAATPPHASQVPPQAESLFMLLKQYPCMWQGLLALKNDQAAVQMYFVSGNDAVAKLSLPKNTDGSTPPLRIFQRMRLEPLQVEGVARKMQMENEHCMLLALPCGHDHMDVLKQSTNLTNGFITYLQQKQAAGIVNVAAPGTSQPPAYVVHIFPSCDFVNDNLRRIAPSLLERVADIAHLLIVITTV